MTPAMGVDLGVLPAFVAAILAFLAPPGPDMTYMIAVGLQGGRTAAIKAILGIGTGMSVYATVVALGLGTLVNSHPAALTLVKLGGAAYLLWLAVTTVRHAREVTTSTTPSDQRWYLRGLMVSLTNPKLILFFLALLPRFLGAAQNPTLQLALLGAVNVAAEVLLYGAIGVGASTFSRRFAGRPHAAAKLHYLAALVYLVIAVMIGGDGISTLGRSHP